jgi:hypothetical protein
MSSHLLDPRRVEQTLGIPYKRYPDGSYHFVLGHPHTELLFRDREPDQVVISLGECSITFASMTRIAYGEKMLILESHTPSHFSILHIEPGGSLHLVTGLDETTYEGSIYEIAYRRATQVPSRRV